MADGFSFGLFSTLLVALVLGGMAFFATVYTPVVFRALPAEMASRLLRALFPVYYKLNAALTAVAAASLALRPEGWALAVVCVLFLVSLLILAPRLNVARDGRAAGDEAARRRFGRLHRINVVISLLQMLILLIVFVRLVPGS